MHCGVHHNHSRRKHMGPRFTPRWLPARRPTVFITGAVLAASAALPGMAMGKLKLPVERTSPTGNFFTLEALSLIHI